MEHWISNTPAATPSKLKNLIIKKPINGPIKTLATEEIKALLNENTLSLVNAIPRDIKIKNIVAYVNNIVVLTMKFGTSILK